MKLNDKALDAAVKASLFAGQLYESWSGANDYVRECFTRDAQAAITAYLDTLKAQGLARNATAREGTREPYETPGSWIASDDGAPRDFPCLIIKLEE